MRKLKSKLAVPLVTLVAVTVISVWYLCPRRPTISFVGYRKWQGEGVAVFKVTNRGHGTFSYWERAGGTGPAYCIRFATASGWQTEAEADFISVPGLLAIGPDSSIEFEVIPNAGAQSPFAVGIAFQQGRPEQILRRSPSRMHERVLGWLSVLMRRNLFQWEKTWSQPVDLDPKLPPNQPAAGQRRSIHSVRYRPPLLRRA